MLSVYSFFIVLFLHLFFVVLGTDPRPSHILSNHNYTTNMQTQPYIYIYEHICMNILVIKTIPNTSKAHLLFFLELLFCLLFNHFLRGMDKAGPVL